MQPWFLRLITPVLLTSLVACGGGGGGSSKSPSNITSAPSVSSTSSYALSSDEASSSLQSSDPIFSSLSSAHSLSSDKSPSSESSALSSSLSNSSSQLSSLGGTGAGSSVPQVSSSSDSSLAQSSIATNSSEQSSQISSQGDASSEASSSIESSSSAQSSLSSSGGASSEANSSTENSTSSDASSSSQGSTSSEGESDPSGEQNERAFTFYIEMPEIQPTPMARTAQLMIPNLYLVTLDDAGIILDAQPLSTDLTLNQDGSFTAVLATQPRLDQLILVHVGSVQAPAAGLTLTDVDEALYSPLTDTIVQINLATTVMFSDYLENLRSHEISLTDAEHALDPVNLAAFASTAHMVQQIYFVGVVPAPSWEQTIGFAKQNTSEFSAALAENVKSRLDETLYTLSAALDNGGLYWFNINDYAHLEYGGVAGDGHQEEYLEFIGDKFVPHQPTPNELVWDDKHGQWVLTGDLWKVSQSDEHGSILLTDVTTDSLAEKLTATNVISLSGRDVDQFFMTERDGQFLRSFLNNSVKFSEGAIGYRSRIEIAKDYYRLWYTSPYSEDICFGEDPYYPKPYELKGNCATLGGNIVKEFEWPTKDLPFEPEPIWDMQYQFYFQSLNDIFSSLEVAPELGTFLSIGWANFATYEAKLFNDENQTVDFYVFDHQVTSANATEWRRKVGSGQWRYVTLPGSTETQAIVFSIPQALINQGFIDNADRNVLIVEQDGIVRRGDYGTAGGLEGEAVLLFNGIAKDDVIRAVAP